VGAKTEGLENMTSREEHARDFLHAAGWSDVHRTLLAGDASKRRYDRLIKTDRSAAILMDAPPHEGEDVRPFIRIANYLRENGMSAPEIYAEDSARGFLLIEDLGDALFARLMERDPEITNALYGSAVDVLLHLHEAPPLTLDLCDANWLTGMTGLVFDWYAKADNPRIKGDFEAIFRPLAEPLDQTDRVVILRDYHAENLIWLPERFGAAKVGLLDFQDALLGHPAYDLVSVLQDARRDVPEEVESRMISRYLGQKTCDKDAFRTAYALLGAQRNLRILGIFARLCIRDGKDHYVDYIPRVWRYLLRNLADPALVPLRKVVLSELSEPTPNFLEHLKSRCATNQTQ